MLRVEFICIANFCRSPAAEKIFNFLSSKESLATSSGVNPIDKIQMDPRSSEFLRSKKITDNFHTPTKINSKKIKECDYLICFELNILLKLQKEYPKNSHKFKIYNYHLPNLVVNDPYKFQNIKDYHNQMESLYIIVQDWHQRLLKHPKDLNNLGNKK